MKPSRNILAPFGINGSLRRRDVQAQNSFTEYYLFNSASNLKAYSNNGLDFAYYGYNASNTRTYKLSMLNMHQWVNGQPEPLHLQLQSAMFYPNAYINFNQNGEYTKHYYNGTERIASRLGDAQPESFVISSNDRLGFRIMQADQQARADLLELVEAGDVPIETPSVDVSTLQTTGTSSDIFYYHTNHLGSTAYVTDQNRNVTQGFIYAPFGEITTEYNATFGNDIIPKYSFNAKELDEETGMYYYEARYYKPPVFTSRDPMFEKYFWMTPYAYCANNPVKYVDPDGKKIRGFSIDDDGNVHINYDKAGKDEIRVYEEMSKTEVGLKQFKTMINSKTKIKIRLTSEKLDDDAHGFTDAGYFWRYDFPKFMYMKKGQYRKATITISTAKYDDDRFKDASEGEMINAIGVHESVHATDQEQIEIDYLGRFFDWTWEKERKTIEMEYTSRTQYNQGNNQHFKSLYEDEDSNKKDSLGNPKPAFHMVY